ncbi:hypothetical protein KKF34_09625 [Myxococcota bacterium]|nr:hypothetical protein [Myxococcota bacterium]MBU1379801.1 hypothetical protein [Myxococcota bacterium]MBU1497123.1 hypothetical protein [Myxococcota bacterium]
MKKVIVLSLAAVFGLVVLSCGPSSEKARKDYKKYQEETWEVMSKAQKHYWDTVAWLNKWEEAKKDEYKKDMGKKTEEFKEFADKMDKVKAGNKDLEKIRNNDVNLLKVVRDIYKEYRTQVTDGKKPHENKAIKDLVVDLKDRIKKATDLRNDYYKKYKPSKGGKTKYKKGKKRKKK